MKPILIVKTGETLKDGPRPGDFEHWIAEGMGLTERALVVDVRHDAAALPRPREVGGVVVTGSAAMVSHRLPWSERTAAWLRGAVHEGAHVLGICYGHQLLAHALGGTVARNPRGREMGSIRVRGHAAAARDPLLGPLFDGRAELDVLATHVEAVLELPPGAEKLAESEGDPHQAFRAGARAFGVQFHPELDVGTMHAYIRARAEALHGEGLDAEALIAGTCQSDDGTRLLRRFAALCRARV